MAVISKEFEALYESECPECGEIIEEGEVIAYCSNHDDFPVCPDCLDKHKDSLGFGL